MESEGLVLNDPEPAPVDPYLTRRTPAQRSYVTPSDFDRLKQFVTMDRKVSKSVSPLHPNDLCFCV